MKLLRWLPVVGIVLLAYGFWQTHQNASDWAAWKAERTRVLAQKDSALQVADSLSRLAERKDSAAKRLTLVSIHALQEANRLRDSLIHLPKPPDTCAIWLDVAMGRAESLHVAMDSLLASNDSLRGANALLHQSIATLKAPINDLTHLVTTVPKGCRVLGIIPCPEVTGGYGATLSGGKVYAGPSLTAGWRIPIGG